jgi:hypothetical protein
MKYVLIFILLLIVTVIAYCGWSYYQSGKDLESFKEKSGAENAAMDRRIDIINGKAQPIYVITSDGRTWESNDPPQTAGGVTVFTDRSTGERVELTGSASIEAK